MLNKMIIASNRWDASVIRTRAEGLAKEVCHRWPRPTSGAVYELAKPDEEDDLSRRKQRQLRYWTAFVDHLKTRNGELQPTNELTSTTLEFPSGVEHVYFWTWLNRAKKAISAGVTLNRRRGRAIFKNLQIDRAAIEKELGSPAKWTENGPCHISVSDEGHTFSDELEWQEQQDWLADTLELLRRVLGPRIKALEGQGAKT